MSDNLRSLIKEHHAFYEVLPYYLSLEERQVSSSVVNRKGSGCFDVELYGVNIGDEFVVPGRDPHSSAEITREIYLHSVPADARSAVEKVEALLIGPKWTQVSSNSKTTSALIH